MGTSWSARIVNAPRGSNAVVEDVLAHVIAQMSNWNPDSDISRFNQAPLGKWVQLPADMITVLRCGLDIAKVSDGAFDPAIGGLVDQWGFGPGGHQHDLAASPAWRSIEINHLIARRHRNVSLDFSGIAKGFAVDKVSEALQNLGVEQFLVEIGGELRGQGIKPDMQPWWVDVEAPLDLDVPILRVALCGLSIATSGDYRRYRIEDDVRLSHSIDPSTGRPIHNDVASVTVLHESAMVADAWATAVTILGADRGMALATRHELAVRLVRRQGSEAMEYMTPAMAAMLNEH